MTSFCRERFVYALVAGALLAGCGAQSAFAPAGQIGPEGLRDFVGSATRDANVPPCKGQKTTKDYAQSKPQAISPKGGTACVPKFGEWGGEIKYPGFSGNGIKMTVISSTSAYDPGAFPPSTNGIFYLQLKFNSLLKFNTKLATGVTLAGKFHNKSSYTIGAARDDGSLWQVLPYCYTTAKAGKYGPMIGGLGYSLENGDFSSYNDAVLWIYPGKHVTQNC